MGWSTTVLLLLMSTTMPQPTAAPTTAEAEAAAKAIQQAFVAGDVAALKGFFAEKLLFVGDPRFLGEDGRRQVTRELTRDQLAAAYTKMLDAMGRAQWTTVTQQAKLSVTRAAKDASHPEDTTGILPPAFVKAGEYLLELKFPGSGLDDVVLFALRPVEGKFKVVAHWADY